MNVKEEKICRLCLKVADKDFEIVDEITREMFKVLSLRVNLDVTKDPIVCKDCKELSIKCLDFKLACTDTEERIFTFAANKNGVAFELKDIVDDGKDLEMVDDNVVCRFCFKSSSANNFVLLRGLLKDVTFAEKLQALMPVMDFDFIKDPVICTTCSDDLRHYIKFADTCLDVEGQINKYCRNDDTRFSGQIELSDVLQLSFKTILEWDDRQIVIKKEDISEAYPEVYNSESVKTEEPLDIKDEVVNFNETVNVYELKNESEMGKGIGRAYQKEYKKKKTVPGVEMYKCPTCAYETIHKGSLKSHMLVHKDISEVEIYKCSTCTYETKRKSSLKNHALVHQDITAVEMYKCTMCTHETRNKYLLKRHKTLIHKIILEGEMYKCSTCTYESKSKSNLKNHIMTHEDTTEAETYKCPLCSYATKHKGNLKIHALVHKNIRDGRVYKCSTCTYETKHKSSLKSHFLIHKNSTEVEMYKCSTCTYESKHKSSLKIHMLTHRDVSEVEIYKCPLCIYETKHKGNLKIHTLVHSDITEGDMYKCSMCMYETKRKGYLKTHMLIHKDITEVETYKCSVCAYETKRKGNLKIHMLIHKDVSEIEIHKCAKCNFQARQRSSLQRHTKRHK